MSKDHVPAWRRLGLKLKFAKEEPRTAKSNGHATPDQDDGPPAKKRRTAASTKPLDMSTDEFANDNLKPVHSNEDQTDKPKKQVSFTTDTKTADGDTAVSIIPSEAVEELFPQKDPTKKTKKQKQPTQPSATKTQGTLEYLTQFYRTHSAWKFNKNREVWILKHALTPSDIPSSYNLMLAQYIYGLKSPNARERLSKDCASSDPGPSLPPSLAETGADALAAFPQALHAEDSGLAKDLQTIARARLILWALNPTDNSEAGPKAPQEVPRTGKEIARPETLQKKRKNRTAVVEYSSSSSSSSSSESESESESEIESDTTGSESGSDSDD